MEQVRFGIVGLGNMGLKHAQIMLRDVQEVRLAAVASRNAANIAQLRAMEGGAQVRVFDTLEQMAQSGEIDAVLIASPHRAHVAQAVQAFARGMHVLLEKPVGVTVRDAREIEAAALASGRAYGVMLNVRTHPCMRRMKEIVDSGEMGAIRRVHYVITDWTRGENYYHSSPWRATWKHDGGGVLLNQAPHNLDLLQWIGGMPASVHAFCGFGRWHDIEVEDDVTAYLEYANGATGTFVTCTGEAPGTNRLELSMDGGQLLFENGRLLVRRLQRPVSAFIRENTGHKTAHRVGDCHGGKLAAGENEISHGDLLIHTFLNEPLVDAFIMTAHEDQMVIIGLESAGFLLRERRACRGEENGMHPFPCLIADMLPAIVKRLHLHNAASSAAVGIIVHLTLLVGGIIPDLVAADLQMTAALGTAKNAFPQNCLHGIREQGHDVKLVHQRPSIMKKRISPASQSIFRTNSS